MEWTISPLLAIHGKRRLLVKILSLIISLIAIVVVFYALLRAAKLNKKIPGGIVKEYWRLLYYLIGLIAAGYLTMPLFPTLPESSRDMVVAIIYLAGAVFIVKVINLLYKIAKEVGL
jgi:hypothetical protein